MMEVLFLSLYKIKNIIINFNNNINIYKFLYFYYLYFYFIIKYGYIR